MPERGPPPGALLETAVVTSDTLVYTGVADVYWVAAGDSSTAGTWQLNDSTNDSGTDKFSAYEEATTATHMLPFPIPIHFDTGIWVDVQGAGLILVVAYVIL